MTVPMNDHTAIDFWLPAVAVFAANFVVYIVAQMLKDNSIVDITWGFVIFLPNIIIVAVKSNWNERTILVLGILLVYAFRMAIMITVRHKGEDRRFAEMRKQWEAKGKTAYYIIALIFFMINALTTLIMNAPALYVSVWSTSQFYALDAVGAGIWLIGFIIELTADIQLIIFKKNPENAGRIYTNGLWGYSRHPNYFGECVQWWGIYLIACSIDYGWASFFGPLITTLLLRFVSGVPLIENGKEQRPDFIQYKQQTNTFIPWFKKKSTTVVMQLSNSGDKQSFR